MIRAAWLGLLGLFGLGLFGACSADVTEKDACSSDEDCTGGNECATYTCEEGACVKQAVAAGTAVYAKYEAGDCKRWQCGQGGTIVQAIDLLDVPVDPFNPCIQGVCNPDGTAGTSTNKMDGAQCGAAPAVKCAGGSCTGCTADADCALPTSVCVTATCAAGVCTYQLNMNPTASDVVPDDCYTAECDPLGTIRVVPVPDDTACGGTSNCSPKACLSGSCVDQLPPMQGTPADEQTQQGDCRSDVCTGTGGIESVLDDMDAPPDTEKGDCIRPGCSSGEVVPVADVGNPCTTPAGLPGTCDAAGNCS